MIQQGGGSDLNAAAQAAAQKNIMAENLAEWQRKDGERSAPLGPSAADGGWRIFTGGQAAVRHVGGFSAKQSQSQQDPSWALSHLAGHALGTAGYAMGGFPGSMAGEALGLLGVKPMIRKMFKLGEAELRGEGHSGGLPADDRSAAQAGAQPGPQVGDMIKNLMLGSAF